MTPDRYQYWLQQHDWYYEQSDDPRSYTKGAQHHDSLLHLAQKQPELKPLLDRAMWCVQNKLPITFDDATPAPSENQTSKTNNMLEETISKLTEAVKELTASISKGLGALTSAPPVEAAPEETPAAPKAEKKKKSVAVPTDEPQPAEEITLESLRLLAGQIKDDSGKVDRFKKAMKTKCDGANSMAECDAKFYPVLKMALEKLIGEPPTPSAEDI